MSNMDNLSIGALRLFRTGSDTMEIARRLGVSEDTASRLVWIARSREKQLPAIYVSQKTGIPRRVADAPDRQSA